MSCAHRGLRHRWSLPALILLMVAALGIGSTQAAPPLPAAAQAALDRGVVAARVADYPHAILFFEEARKAAPEAPIVYLNLGLAESKIPGRELRAMAWFGAYLAADSAAAKATAVKTEIASLRARSRGNTSRLIENAQQVASLIPEPTWQDVARRNLALAQARSGDIRGAKTTADLIKLSDPKTDALIGIAEAEIGAGDLRQAKSTWDTALKSAGRIDREPQLGVYSPATSKGQAYRAIAFAQAAAGQVAAALKTADLMSTAPDRADNKSYVLRQIAEASAGVGDTARAQQALASAQKTLERIADPGSKKWAVDEIAKTREKIGGKTPNRPAQQSAPCSLVVRDAPSVGDWLVILDDSDTSHTCALNSAPFRDLAGYLKRLPSRGYARQTFADLQEAVDQIVDAEVGVNRMLASQFGF